MADAEEEDDGLVWQLQLNAWQSFDGESFQVFKAWQCWGSSHGSRTWRKGLLKHSDTLKYQFKLAKNSFSLKFQIQICQIQLNQIWLIQLIWTLMKTMGWRRFVKSIKSVWEFYWQASQDSSSSYALSWSSCLRRLTHQKFW